MKIHILEMPLDFGASRHGSDMGPSAIRLAGIKQRLEDLGHSTFEHTDIFHAKPQEYQNIGNPKAKYLKPIVNACTKLAGLVEEISGKNEFPLVLGGDHSIALGSAQQQKNKINLSAYFMSTRTEILTIQTQRRAEIFTESVLQPQQESDFLNLQTSILKDRKSIQKTSALSVAATLILAKKL